MKLIKTALTTALTALALSAGESKISGFFIQPSLGYGVTGTDKAGQAVFDSQTAYDNWVKGMADVGAEMLFYQWSVHYWADQNWFASAYGTPASADFAFYDIAPKTISGIPAQSWTKPTNWPGTDVEPLKRALDACGKNGVKLWIGLYLNEASSSYNWWDAVNNDELTAKDSAIIKYHIDRTVSMVPELYAKFGTHPAFGGFYYPVEIANLGFTPESNWPMLAHLLDTVADAVHAQNPETKLSISPFFNTAGSIGGSGLANAETFGKMWNYTLANSDLDIVILQDGVGVDPFILTKSADLISPYYQAVKKACDANGRKFWANCELFENKGTRENPKFVPASLEKVALQLKTEMAYAEKSVCFSYQYMDPNSRHTFPGGTYTGDSIPGGDAPARLKLYNDYKHYIDTLTTGTVSVKHQSAGTAPVSVQAAGNQLSITGLNGSVQLSISDLRGKEILRRTVSAGQSVSVEQLARGTYVVNVRTNGIVKSVKMIR